jgi:hypothetical protein
MTEMERIIAQAIPIHKPKKRVIFIKKVKTMDQLIAQVMYIRMCITCAIYTFTYTGMANSPNKRSCSPSKRRNMLATH